MVAWSVPRCFEGRTVAILASGESMSQRVANQVRDAGIPAIAINNTFRLAPWAWMLYAADQDWWQHRDNRDAWGFAGLKATVHTPSGKPAEGLLALKYSGAGGFDADPSRLRTGGNGGYQAVHIAAHTGASRILLCGMDMQGGHWHGDHPPGLKVTTTSVYERWRARFGELVGPLAKRGIEVVNCTPGSRLECFRCARLEDELAESLEPASTVDPLPA